MPDHRFLNIRLDDIAVSDPERFPHMVSRSEEAQLGISGSGQDRSACAGEEGGS